MLSEPTVRPRHRIRAYGRVVKASGEAEYKRFLDFLAQSTSTQNSVLLSNKSIEPQGGRRETPQQQQLRSTSINLKVASKSRHNRGFERSAGAASSGVINFAPGADSARISGDNRLSAAVTNHLAQQLSTPADSQSSALFSTHLAADFASQMAAELQHANLESSTAVVEFAPSDAIDREQGLYAIQSVSVLEEELAAATQLFDSGVYLEEPFAAPYAELPESSISAPSSSAIPALAPSPMARSSSSISALASNSISALASSLSAASEQTAQPEQFLSQAANMLEEWFEKDRTKDEEEPADDNELVDGPAAGAVATTPGSLISRLTRITQKELDAIRESSPQKKPPSARRAPPSRTQRGQGRKHWLRPSLIPLDNGNRKELYANGAAMVKDAVGRVCEVSAANGASISFSYDPEGHLSGFVRSNVSGKVHSTGGRDKHGVVVRDPDGRVRAQGESMSVDPRGCLSIRRFDGQFWSVDLVRGMHIERRILQDLDGQWNSLTALLTSDGFRMVTRFQKLADTTESYRRYGDWLTSQESSKFRFYGRDGSVIQFDSDEDLQSLRPARIWSPGSRPIDSEWQGIRQAGTAWDSVHQYVSQYLSTL